MDNQKMDILMQGLTTIGLMIAVLSPEIYALYRGIDCKGTICVLGIMSKVAVIYFFSSVIAGTFLS